MYTSLHKRQVPSMLRAPDDGGGNGGDGKEESPEKKAFRERLARQGEQLDAAKAAKEAAEQRAAAAEKAAADAKREAERQQREGLPELDKLKADLEDAQQQIASLTSERDNGFAERDEKIVDLERGGWVRSAAAAAGFHDSEDAVLRINLNDLKTEDAAKKAVERLAEGKPHLISAKEEPRGGELLEQVLSNGKAVQPGEQAKKDANRPAKYSLDQIKAMTPEQIQGDLDEVNRSVELANQ